MAKKTKVALRTTSNLSFPPTRVVEPVHLRGFHNDIIDSIADPEMLSLEGTFNYIQYNTESVGESGIGSRRWNDRLGTTELRLKGGNVTLQDGEELVAYCYNNTPTYIYDGKAVIITSGILLEGIEYDCVELAIASDSGNTFFRTSGIATEDIPPYSFGFITVMGRVNDLDLTSFSVGETIYLSQTVPGELVHYTDLSINGRVSTIGKVLSNSLSGSLRLLLQNEFGVSNNTLLELNVLNANNSSTGIYYFNGIEPETSTTVEIGEVKGWIVDNETNSENPTVQHVHFLGRTGITTEYLPSSYLTYFLISKESKLLSQSYFPTPEQRRQNIFIGKIAHPNNTEITSILSFSDHNLSPLSQIRDYLQPIPLINNGITPYPNSNLTFGNTSGILHGLGINFRTSISSPNQKIITGTNPQSFKYRSQIGETGIPDPSLRTLIDPLRWDNGGVIQLVGTPAKQATNQRIYLIENGEWRIQYGQVVYADLNTAISNATREPFILFPPFKEDAILVGILSVASDATNLQNPLQARFLPVSKFGESTGTGGSLVATENLFTIPLNTVLIKGPDGSPITGSNFKYEKSGDLSILTLGSTFQVRDESGDTYLQVRRGDDSSTIIGKNAGYTSNPTFMRQSVIIGENAVQTPYNTSTSFYRNIALGLNAGQNLLTGSSESIFIGSFAGGEVQRSEKGILIGEHAGYASSQSLDMTCIGSYAGAHTRPGTVGGYVEAPIFIGDHAGEWGEGVDHLIAIGDHAGSASLDASGSIFIGKEAGDTAHYGEKMIAIGQEAGKDINTSSRSILIGDSAGQKSTNSTKTIAIGDHPGHESLNIGGSILIGEYAGQGADTIQNSIVMGYQAGQLGLNSDRMIAIGYQAGYTGKKSEDSIYIGTRTGMNGYMETGWPESGNIVIGSNITLPSGSKNSMNLGGVLFATGLNKTPDSSFQVLPRILSETGNGRVGINTLTPEASLHVKGTMLVSGSIGGIWVTDQGIQLTGSATVFEKLSADPSRMMLSGSYIAHNIGEGSIQFPDMATLSSYAQTSYTLPGSWKVGSPVYPQLRFWQKERNLPNLLLYYRWQTVETGKTEMWESMILNQESFEHPGTSTTVNQTVFSLSPITPPPEALMGSILQVRLMRDNLNTSTLFSGIDTYTGVAEFISLEMVIEKDTLGSNTKDSK